LFAALMMAFSEQAWNLEHDGCAYQGRVAGLDGPLRVQKAFLDREPEWCAVVELGTPELTPGIGAGVNMDHADLRETADLAGTPFLTLDS
jgi:hypothetical protein